MTPETTATGSQTMTYAIDPAHSSARFSIRHLMIAHAQGEFTQLSGTVQLAPGDLASLQVEATIDTPSFHTGQAQRDEHVKSQEFLDVAQYPTITFRSTQARPGSGQTAQVVGDLTLHGVTQPVTLQVSDISEEITDPWGNPRFAATATTQIKRSDFGVTFNAPVESGGVMLSDEVAVTLNLQMTRQAG